MTDFHCTPTMLIGKLPIGASVRPKIIAEVGINHGGCLDTAKKICELAAKAGADVIKTQMHIPHEEMSDAAKRFVPSHCNESIFNIMESCSLPIDQEYELKHFIEQLGVEYLCTPFSAEAAHILGRDFQVNSFKIGSGECNNDFVLKAAASYKKPLIISTGMNTLASCEKTYGLVNADLGLKVVLMHTTNIYPTPYELVRLGGIKELQSIAGNDCVGLSDHTQSNLACLGAVALGAVLLERHFTDSKDRMGPDIANSMDCHELSELRLMSEQMFLMRGGTKTIEIQEEQGTRDFAFATFVALEEITKGDIIVEDNIAPKRPANGDFFARDLNLIIGKKAICPIPKGTHLLKSHLNF
jgi:N-acetylneuraminate synthase